MKLNPPHGIKSGFRKKGVFDRGIDSINRMIRPFLVFGILFIISLPLWNPAYFAEIMVAYAGVPAPFWDVIYLVFTVYLTSRMVERVNTARLDSRGDVEAAKQAGILSVAMREDRLAKKREGHEGDPERQAGITNETIRSLKR